MKNLMVDDLGSICSNAQSCWVVFQSNVVSRCSSIISSCSFTPPEAIMQDKAGEQKGEDQAKAKEKAAPAVKIYLLLKGRAILPRIQRTHYLRVSSLFGPSKVSPMTCVCRDSPPQNILFFLVLELLKSKYSGDIWKEHALSSTLSPTKNINF